MGVNLQKGQKVDLSKGGSGLKKVMVGLGWDEVEQKKKLFGKKPEDIDCDAIAFLLNKDGKLANSKDAVYFNNLSHSSGCVTHQGDNLTGAGEGDDEQILVNLADLPAQYERIVILVSIYQAPQRNQHFGMINNAFIRLVDYLTGEEVCIYNLSENYSGKTAMVFGELYRKNGAWKFNAIGEPLNIWAVSDLAAKFGLAKPGGR